MVVRRARLLLLLLVASTHPVQVFTESEVEETPLEEEPQAKEEAIEYIIVDPRGRSFFDGDFFKSFSNLFGGRDDASKRKEPAGLRPEMLPPGLFQPGGQRRMETQMPLTKPTRMEVNMGALPSRKMQPPPQLQRQILTPGVSKPAKKSNPKIVFPSKDSPQLSPSPSHSSSSSSSLITQHGRGQVKVDSNQPQFLAIQYPKTRTSSLKNGIPNKSASGFPYQFQRPNSLGLQANIIAPPGQMPEKPVIPQSLPQHQNPQLLAPPPLPSNHEKLYKPSFPYSQKLRNPLDFQPTHQILTNQIRQPASSSQTLYQVPSTSQFQFSGKKQIQQSFGHPNKPAKSPKKQASSSFFGSLREFADEIFGSSTSSPLSNGPRIIPTLPMAHRRFDTGPPTPVPQRIDASVLQVPERQATDFLPSPQEGSMLDNAFQPIFVASQSLDKELPHDAMKPMIIPQKRNFEEATERPIEIIDFF